MKTFTAAALLLLLSATSFAQLPPNLNPNDPSRTFRENERKFHPLPYEQGAWYTPGRGGSGWFFSSVDPNPTTQLTSATLFSYDETGKAAWTIGTAPRVVWPMGAEAIWSDSAWGVWRADMVEGVTGTCPTCAYQPSTFAPSRFGSVEMTWTGPASINLKLGAQNLGILRPSDLIVGASFEQRIAGRHYATRRSVLNQSNNTRVVNTNKCLIDIVPVPAPVPAFTVDPTFRTNVVPPAGAQWFRMAAECVLPSQPLPTFIDSQNANLQVWYIALGSADAPFAHFVTLAGNQISRDGAGNPVSFRFTRNTEVGRIFIDGAHSLSLHLAQLQDERTVGAEWRITRGLPDPADYSN